VDSATDDVAREKDEQSAEAQAAVELVRLAQGQGLSLVNGQVEVFAGGQ
jgi:hypothetical protein